MRSNCASLIILIIIISFLPPPPPCASLLFLLFQFLSFPFHFLSFIREIRGLFSCASQNLIVPLHRSLLLPSSCSMLTQGVPRGAPGVTDFKDIAEKNEKHCASSCWVKPEKFQSIMQDEHSGSLTYSVGWLYHYIFVYRYFRTSIERCRVAMILRFFVSLYI